MTDSITYLLELLLAAVSGCVLGLAYFGGLWWTVRRLPQARRPLLLYVGSMLLRGTLLLVILLWIALYREAAHLLACLAGMIAARLMAVRATQSGGGGS